MNEQADQSDNPDNSGLRDIIEKTVPSEEFSAEGTRREMEREAQPQTPSTAAQQFLLKTITDAPGAETAGEESGPRGFSTTSLVPPELLVDDEKEGPRFTVLEEAGRGGTAFVYSVADRSLGRTIALKLLRSRNKQVKGVQRRFIHEARITAILEHPNIVPVYDIGVTDDGCVYFLMKNVTGVSAGDAIRALREGEEAPPQVRSVDGWLRVLLKVCDAVAFAHSKGYIHQDIKPDNIMLGAYGEVLVLDWGSALGRDNRPRDSRAVFGTPAYMSPEQARQENADERSDVYCLGATMYHMVTLSHPTWSDDPIRFWEMKRAGTVNESPGPLADDVPEALLAIALKAMAPDPQERYQSVADFQKALLEYQDHAESITLTQRTCETLENSGAGGEYHDYVRVTARFEQALEMWPENTDAAEGLTAVRRRHALLAVSRGDLTLAQSIIDSDSAFDDVRRSIETEKQLRSRKQVRAKKMIAVAASAGVLLAALFGYYVFDYFRYFGKWQPLYHIDFTDERADLNELAFSLYVLTQDIPPPERNPRGLLLAGNSMFWARNIRERGDVRVEVVIRWEERVDGLEIMLNSRREQEGSFALCPTGYSCQFAGWGGTVNIISRNAKPQAPDQGNSVGCEFELGRRYRLWFQREGEELSLFVDGRLVFRTIEPLPLVGEELEWIGVRSWPNAWIESFTVWRMGAPAKASPLIAGDAFVQRGQMRDAAKVYVRTGRDHAGTAIEAQALTRAYLVASQIGDPDSLRPQIRELMQASHRNSRYWAQLLQADCLSAWSARRYDEALVLAAKTLEHDPDSRVALRMLSGRPKDVPGPKIDGLLRLISRTSAVHGLNLDGLALSDISPLKGLALRVLSMCDNNVADLSPLQGMPLRLLLARNNPLTDLTPLVGAKLVSADFNGCDIADISALAGMPLNDLSLSNTLVESIEPLKDMPLVVLYLTKTPILSLEPLRGMKKLNRLELVGTAVESLDPLRGLRTLRRLSIDDTRVSSLEPLRDMELGYLTARLTRITDLEPLSTSTLRELLIDHNRIESLQPLSTVPLTNLSIVGCGMSDIRSLQGLLLTSFVGRSNGIRDISALAGMPLRNLDLADNRVEDLSPLDGMELNFLNVLGNPLRNLYPFETSYPKRIWFDSIAAQPGYVSAILERWEQEGDTMSARFSKAALGFRRGDTELLRRTATGFAGHWYVYVPTPLSFEEAKEAAQRFGGHLATISSREEMLLIGSLFPDGIGVWLGIDPQPGVQQWITGEPLLYHNYFHRRDRMISGNTMMVRQHYFDTPWYKLTDGATKTGIVIEWDS